VEEQTVATHSDCGIRAVPMNVISQTAFSGTIIGFTTGRSLIFEALHGLELSGSSAWSSTDASARKNLEYEQIRRRIPHADVVPLVVEVSSVTASKRGSGRSTDAISGVRSQSQAVLFAKKSCRGGTSGELSSIVRWTTIFLRPSISSIAAQSAVQEA